MRSVCEKQFQKLLQKDPMRPGVYFQTGVTMVVVETRQWKMAYSPMEKTRYDLTDEDALILEVPGDHGVHIVPWNVILRITVNQGVGL